MNQSSTKSLLALAALAGLLGFNASQAQPVTWDFDDNDASVDSNGLSGDGVTTANVGISTQDSTVIASIANGRAQRDLGTSAADVSATFSFTLEIGATPVNLTQLDFTHGLDVNAGSVNTNYFEWVLAITTTGSGTPGASQTTFDEFTNNTDVTFDESVALSGLSNLTNEDVTFEFTGRYGTESDYTSGQNDNRFIYLDDVTFSGSVVPEPSAFALLGGIFALTWVMLRRRS